MTVNQLIHTLIEAKTLGVKGEAPVYLGQKPTEPQVIRTPDNSAILLTKDDS